MKFLELITMLNVKFWEDIRKYLNHFLKNYFTFFQNIRRCSAGEVVLCFDLKFFLKNNNLFGKHSEQGRKFCNNYVNNVKYLYSKNTVYTSSIIFDLSFLLKYFSTAKNQKLLLNLTKKIPKSLYKQDCS